MLLSGAPRYQLLEIDRICGDWMERMVRQMAGAEGVDEKMKASDQPEWVSRMNGIRQRAEETVLDELIFD